MSASLTRVRSPGHGSPRLDIRPEQEHKRYTKRSERALLGVHRFFRLANGSGVPGLSCDETGLHLGGAPLLRRTAAGFEPRLTHEVEALIAKAYGGAEDGTRLACGLRVVADCLNKGEMARAMIAAVYLSLPDLDQDGADGVAKIDALLRQYILT